MTAVEQLREWLEPDDAFGWDPVHRRRWQATVRWALRLAEVVAEEHGGMNQDEECPQCAALAAPLEVDGDS